MKICVICDVLGQENNGTTIAGMNLIRSLKSKGYDVNIVCNDVDKKDVPGYYVVPEWKLPFLTNVIHRNGVKLSKIDKKVMTEALKDVDHVHFLLPFKLSQYAVKYCKKNNISTTASFHAQAENVSSHLGLKNAEFFSKWIYKYFNSKLYKHVDGIHYPTNFIKDVFEEVVGETNSYVISNGVNDIYTKKEVERPTRFEGKFVILNIGRLCSEKDQSTLIKGIAESKYKDKIHLVLAGSGPDKAKIVKLANKLGISYENDFYSRKDLVDIINSSDLYCHSADVEIEAISCIEAITCGLVPVIANSKKSATRFFAIDDNCLFEKGNPKDLAKKIDYWIENPKEKEFYSKKYRDNSFTFNQKACMDKMEEMIIEIHNEKEKNYES